MKSLIFDDVADILNGFAFDSKRFNEDRVGTPLIRIRDVVSGSTHTYFQGDYDAAYVVNPGDLLVGMDGEFNVAFWQNGKALLNQRVCKIISKNTIADKYFLKHWLSVILKRIESETPFVTVKHLSSEELKQEKIELPKLAEQRRIAIILEKADRVRRLRRYALELSEGYLQSVFLGMFGDLARNEKGWRVSALEKVGHVFGGLQLSASRERLVQKAPYLRVANVFRDRLDLDEVKTMGVTHNEYLRTRMSFGDLLLVEGHGNLQEIGRCAIWDGSIESCLHQNHLIRVRLDPSVLRPVYASRYINSYAGRRYFSEHSNTTSGLNTINTSTVGSLPIHISPLPMQIEFESVVIRHERIRAQQREGLRQAEHLFQTLLCRAFSVGL